MSPVPVISDRQKRFTLFALLVVFLLAALDMTILSTAMPRIIADLNGLELYAWVTTAYMLTATVLVPICGKLGDIYGRKTVLVWGIAIFLLGSALSGLSGEFGPLPILGDGIHQLIIFRAVKGIGGAALFTNVIAIVADLYAPRERAKFMGLFGAVFGLSSIVGPAVGGLLTDYATVTLFGHTIPGWRWVFYVNLPLGLMSLYLIVRKTPATNQAAGGSIDFLGAALFIAAFIPILLALTWGGHQYPWGSPIILGLFGGALLALLLFVWVEHKASNPIMPLSLFKIPAFVITNTAAFVIGMAFLGMVMFMPLYMQVVQGVSASNSGIGMFPLMLGMMVSSMLSGRLVSRWGFYKSFLVGGNLVLVAGVFALTYVGPDTSLWDLAWRMTLVGVGLGPSQSLTNVVVQSAVSVREIGTATSATQFFRQIGSTVGIALFGTFLTLNLHQELPEQLSGLPGMNSEQVDLSQAQSLAMNPSQIRGQVQARFDELYVLVAQAYRGDQAALAAVQANTYLPENLKQAVAVGQALPGAQVEQLLVSVRHVLDQQAEELTQRMSRGIRVAFSNAITGMYTNVLWIVMLGFIISCFVPIITLHSKDVSVRRQESTQPPDEQAVDSIA